MRDASLDITTSGQCEVRLYDEPDQFGPNLVRRRHVDSLEVAERMIVTWLDGTPEIWDAAFGDTGSFEEWAREHPRSAARLYA